MNLSGERVGHRMDEKLLWGPGARILPQARPLSPAAETFRGSGAPGGSPVPAVLRLQALLLPPEAGGWLLPSLSHHCRGTGTGWSRTASVC